MSVTHERNTSTKIYLIAGALLHDVGKLLEYEMKDGKIMKSKFGEKMRHPAAGAQLAEECDLPKEVVHIIAAHSHEGDSMNRSPEAIIIHHCDFIDFEIKKTVQKKGAQIIMKLYEFEAKKVFEKMGIPIPKQYGLIHSVKELDALKLEFPLMLKSMVLVGGRGKAGGIKKAKNREEAKKIAADLFTLKIKGFPVECVLVEEAVEEIGACYIGITMDPATFNNVVIVSASGGVDIEQVAVKNPEAILRKEIPDNSKEISKDNSTGTGISSEPVSEREKRDYKNAYKHHCSGVCDVSEI